MQNYLNKLSGPSITKKQNAYGNANCKVKSSTLLEFLALLELTPFGGNDGFSNNIGKFNPFP
jgi:hypothetical protein